MGSISEKGTIESAGQTESWSALGAQRTSDILDECMFEAQLAEINADSPSDDDVDWTEHYLSQRFRFTSTALKAMARVCSRDWDDQGAADILLRAAAEMARHDAGSL